MQLGLSSLRGLTTTFEKDDIDDITMTHLEDNVVQDLQERRYAVQLFDAEPI